MGRALPKAERFSEIDEEITAHRKTLNARPRATSNGNIEADFCSEVPKSHRRRFGQFFTPDQSASLMANWISEISPSKILDPAVGTGVLLRKAGTQSPNAHLVGYDIDPLCIEYASKSLEKHNAELMVDDFLITRDAESYDGIIANPPYLRHHDISYPFDIFSEYSKSYGIKLSKLGNAYILFLIKSLSLLKEGGRAAFIIPAEWTNANFGNSIKQMFAQRDILRHVVYFDHKGHVFDDNLSTGCLLLIENSKSDGNMQTHFVPADISAEKLVDLFCHESNIKRQFSIAYLSKKKKWDHIISKGIQEEIKGLVHLKNLARTKRGIATGANAFFHISESVASLNKFNSSNLKKCIGKARQSNFLSFTESDWSKLKETGGNCYIVDFEEEPNHFERKYIQQGELEGINRRYLTKTRKIWYSMEKQTPSPIWAAVFGRNEMRFIVNTARICNLTTFHCVYPLRDDPLYIAALACCLNSQIVQDRARANSRVYGGGLVKFEPKDLLEIEVPDLNAVDDEMLTELANSFNKADNALRNGEGFDSRSLDSVVLKAAQKASLSYLL